MHVFLLSSSDAPASSISSHETKPLGLSDLVRLEGIVPEAEDITLETKDVGVDGGVAV